MRIISKVRSLPSLWKYSVIINPSLHIHKRSASGGGAAKNNERLLLQRFDGNTAAEHFLFFSTLSTENFEPIESLYLPCFEEMSNVSGSCNGWLHLDGSIRNSLLWNPSLSTNHVHFLPPCLDSEDDDLSYRVASGFGFDSKSQDYKVVNFIIKDFEQEQVVLYSLNSNSWSNIRDFPREFHTVLGSHSAYVNGCYYWAASVKGEYGIVSFDFASEDFSRIMLPETGKKFRRGRYNCKLVDFEGGLGLIAYPRWGTDKCFEFWVLENNESWVCKWSVCVSGAKLPLGLWGNNGRQLLFLEGMNREAMVYDLAAKNMKKLGIYNYPDYPNYPVQMQLIPYVENTRNLIAIYD